MPIVWLRVCVCLTSQYYSFFLSALGLLPSQEHLIHMPIIAASLSGITPTCQLQSYPTTSTQPAMFVSAATPPVPHKRLSRENVRTPTLAVVAVPNRHKPSPLSSIRSNMSQPLLNGYNVSGCT